MKCLFLLCVMLLPLWSWGQTTITFQAEMDNTIFAENGNVSGGMSTNLFVGRTQGGNGTTLRRALISFDISSIPAGATVMSANLRVSGTNGGPNTVSVHRLSADWGESNSSGSGQGGPASTGDATWTHRFFGAGGSTWTNLGGDFILTPSSDASVLNGSNTTFATSGMTSDVQSWVDNPGSNFGWILIGQEDVSGSAVRIGSRESSNAPELSVTYSAAQPTTDIRINELDPTNQWVELYNGSMSTIDIDGWWLCNRANNGDLYDQIGSADMTLISGSLLMTPGSYVVLGWSDIGQTVPSELGLYVDNNFGSAQSMEDYIQYNGVASPNRAGTAVQAGVWSNISHFVAPRTDLSHSLGLNAIASNEPTSTDYFDWTEQEVTQGAVNENCGQTQLISFDIPTGEYGYVDILTSDASVISASDVLFRAGQEIVLNPTFEILTGTIFTAEIFCN